MKRIKTKVYGRFTESNRACKDEVVVCERLKPEDFLVSKSFRYGFPYQPTCLAYDPVQSILAVGTYSGALRILGRPGVESHVQHESSTPVRNLLFLVNEGALISNCPEDCIHLWNLRQAQPLIVQSLRFNRERITCLHLPFTSKWLYVGTEKGNVHVVNIEKFELSGYTINWNKAIELHCKTHPGPVVHICDNPLDSNKILLGYESGTVVLWSLRSKCAEQRFIGSQRSLTSVHWLNDGKQFMCSHSDGTLSVWTLKCTSSPAEVLCPHGKPGKERPCAPISKVQWLGTNSGDPLVIFSGGMTKGKRKGLTLCQGKTTKVLTSESILDFTCILTTPWSEDMQDPKAVVAVTPGRLLVFDIITHSASKPMALDVPYAFEIHESPVTCTQYFTDCPPDLISTLGSIGSRPKKKHAQKEMSRPSWPITGGVSGDTSDKPPTELIITGHADGTVKFWDASSATVHSLYKLSTAKLLDKQTSSESSDSGDRKTSHSEGSESGDHPISMESKEDDTEAYCVQLVELCPHSRTLVVAGATYALLYQFSMTEQAVELVQIEVHFAFDAAVEPLSSPDPDSATQQGDRGSTSSPSHSPTAVSLPCVNCKTGVFKRHAGFQAELGCVIAGSSEGWPVTNISFSSQFGILTVCNGPSLALVDIIQKKLITVFSAQEMSILADSPSVAPPATPITSTPVTPGTSISFTLNLDGGGGLDFSDATVAKLEKKRNKPPRPPPPVRNKSIVKTGDASNGVDSTEGGRQRTSSAPSIEGSPPDVIQCTRFACSFTKKHDTWISPCLFVGTAQGNVFVVVINMPPPEERHLQPILTITTGTVYRPKSGSIMALALIDGQGHLFPSPLKFWCDKKRDSQITKHNLSARESSDRHFLVACTESEAKVYPLPPTHSHPTIYSKAAVAEDSAVVVSANVVVIEGSSCLVCLNSIGRLMALGLPSLTSLMDIECNFLLTDFRFLRTLRFSDGGQAIILCSPFEIQKMSVFTRSDSLTESKGTLFSAVEAPEAPSKGFFTSLFTSAASPLDREQLFGTQSGAASRSVAERMQGPGMDELQEASAGMASVMQKNREALAERGEKLSQLDKKTAEMNLKASGFADAAHAITLKYKDKKWYQV